MVNAKRKVSNQSINAEREGERNMPHKIYGVLGRKDLTKSRVKQMCYPLFPSFSFFRLLVVVSLKQTLFICS